MSKNLEEDRLRDRTYLAAYRRIRDIHLEISSGRFPSVSDLANRLGVSSRTIKRDLDVMRDSLGAPILYERSHSGFRYMNPGWALIMDRMTEGEMLAFFIAENALQLTGQTPEAAMLKRALAKLAAMLPEQVSVDLSALGESVSFQNTAFAPVAPDTLKQLAGAALERRTVEFDYYSPYNRAHSHRKADVHLLHNFAGDWYAVSLDHDSGEFRDFHAGRISDLSVTELFFEPEKSWNAAEYLRRGFYMTRGGRLTTVSICFDEYQAQWIRERHYFHPDETREELPDGSLRLSFPVGQKGLEAVARFCMTYADHCRVERPAKLKRLVADKLQRARELNG